MEKELNKEYNKVDSIQLLNRFILSCKKKAEDSDAYSPLLSFADIVTAVYYYRRYSDVNEFIQKHLKGCGDYFLIQWVRNTWATLSKMTEVEISDLVINQIALVANSEEDN